MSCGLSATFSRLCKSISAQTLLSNAFTKKSSLCPSWRYVHWDGVSAATACPLRQYNTTSCPFNTCYNNGHISAIQTKPHSTADTNQIGFREAQHQSMTLCVSCKFYLTHDRILLLVQLSYRRCPLGLYNKDTLCHNNKCTRVQASMHNNNWWHLVSHSFFRHIWYDVDLVDMFYKTSKQSYNAFHATPSMVV